MKPFFDIKAQYDFHREEINESIQLVLDSGSFIMGPQVKELEYNLQQYTQAKYCISCANGTDALQIAMMAIGIGAGDEVITTPFTFISTAETVALIGAKSVFVDIEEDSFLIDHNLIADKINSRTKAIIPVSLYGQIADMDAICELAEFYSQKFGHKIYVIEDAAQSFGATYKGKKSCNLSDIATTSFFPTKPLGCYGDGGAIFTSNDDLAQKMSQIRVHGQSKRYHHTQVGINSRLDTIQAAILLVKLKYFDGEIETRREIAKKYSENYRNSSIITPTELKDRQHVYGQYTVRVKERPLFIENLKKEGIPTAIHYPIPLNRQPAFSNGQFDCPISDKLSQEVVSLPMCLYGDRH